MIYLVGAGYMAREYSKVLLSLNEPFVVIGRGESAVQGLIQELGVNAVSGGLTKYLNENDSIPAAAIVCAPVEFLPSIAIELIEFGVKKILLEKPGALSIGELKQIKAKADSFGSLVLIGYNRRFYQSTIALRERLKNETLIASNFEMTEWAHLIADEPYANEVKQKWVLANTSHVIDLVTFITGGFKELSSYFSGSLPWHDKASRFVGSGISESGVLISYCGYWDGPGRWSAEFVTTENRYIFRPMEKLQIQKLGSVSINYDESIDYSLDSQFKPGLYLQTSSFLSNAPENFCSLDEQISNFSTFEKIANYSSE